MMSVLAQFEKIEPFRLFPKQASNFAPEMDALYFFLTAVSLFFTVLIFGLLIFFVIKYRRKHVDEYPEQLPTNMVLELTWTFIPLLIALVMFFWGAKLFVRMSNIPQNAMEIAVTGKQWMWNVQHPTGKREKNELHVPLGRPVKLRMTSEDVIHSFALPAFRAKHDVVPGRYTEMWFTPTEAGTYYLFCTEYCGTLHSGMVGRLVVMGEQEYAAWLTNSVADEAPHLAGAKLFEQFSCITCHGQQAPTLANIYGTPRRVVRGGKTVEVFADEDYVRRAILNPQAELVEGYPPLMPTYQGILTEDQVNQLIAYVKSLNDTNSSRPEGRPVDAAPMPQGAIVPDPAAASGPRESVMHVDDGIVPFGSATTRPTTQP
ncbi:MAG TPA: cytochrome c oxidase subunit II [Tepidisphaeraceae bacterium]|jgi:cytochrome c oxidase subunit 2|nr:cytochrome c oxidase subunit II [Tepidisphaeraceae bacterium]